MAFRYREDLVGKRFLSVNGVTKINVNKVSEWGWKAGVIRAASHKDNKNKELQVLVEYDGVDWQRREWVAVYSRRTFRVFLVERTLVWAPKKIDNKEIKWPALTFTPLAADVTLQADTQPVEFLHDKELLFLDYANLQPYQEWDARLAGSESAVDAAVLAAVGSEAAEWRTVQDGQRILTSTPSVLGGCRAQVYRAAGATQWYTAVIVGVNDHTGELTVTDDTVLEEHSEDPALVQMRLLGDGVIESIMRGEVVGVMPRRSRSNLQLSVNKICFDIRNSEILKRYVCISVCGMRDRLRNSVIVTERRGVNEDVVTVIVNGNIDGDLVEYMNESRHNMIALVPLFVIKQSNNNTLAVVYTSLCYSLHFQCCFEGIQLTVSAKTPLVMKFIIFGHRCMYLGLQRLCERSNRHAL
ncbi:unnamed protein product [Leptidea sinapis]|uniref:Tudor domain-containing protein n=1 Tax=Leptidea sinapis TaxID=189913 RepID=A0A5E4Q4N8_9NEOP|nr:unnamed protein product [Leptidea sinapis]